MEDLIFDKALDNETAFTKAYFVDAPYNAFVFQLINVTGDVTATVQHSYDNVNWVDDSVSYGGSVDTFRFSAEKAFAYIRVKLVCTGPSTYYLRGFPVVGGSSSSSAVLVEQATIPEAEDNDLGVITVVKKPLSSATFQGTRGQNNSFTTFNVKAAAGNLIYAVAHNTTGSTVYLQVHDTATTPANGATAYRKFAVPANSMLILGREELGPDGVYCPTGVALAASTALSTFTAATAGDLVVDYNFI